MRRRDLLVATLALCGASAISWGAGSGRGVEVKADEAQRKVAVTIDGQPFTNYVWPTSLKKPVLFPIIAPEGIEVTRGYPLTPHGGERTDHPHHAGLWFNYGNVNGFDFWNNSDAIKPEQRPKMGTIQQDRIVSTRSGKDSGELVVESTWITGEGKPILKQTTRYVFARHGDERSIDDTTKLTALDKAVFHDDKEGLLGMRVARWLESANEKGGVFRDADGRETKVEGSSGSGATGVYETSEGKQGDAAWGTRGRWCLLTGSHDGKTVTIAMLDHKGNPGYPTYWHARGYGLFAANPLGAHIFDPKAPQFDYTLEKGQTATFRYRILFAAKKLSADDVNHAADTFNAESR